LQPLFRVMVHLDSTPKWEHKTDKLSFFLCPLPQDMFVEVEGPLEEREYFLYKKGEENFRLAWKIHLKSQLVEFWQGIEPEIKESFSPPSNMQSVSLWTEWKRTHFFRSGYQFRLLTSDENLALGQNWLSDSIAALGYEQMHMQQDFLLASARAGYYLISTLVEEEQWRANVPKALLDPRLSVKVVRQGLESEIVVSEEEGLALIAASFISFTAFLFMVKQGLRCAEAWEILSDQGRVLWNNMTRHTDFERVGNSEVQADLLRIAGHYARTLSKEDKTSTVTS